MLPLLELDFSALCQSTIDFSRLDGLENRTLNDAEIEKTGRTFTGRAFAFRDEELQERADRTKQNLDQLLSRHLAYGFAAHPIKRTSIIWLGRRFDSVIAVSDKEDSSIPTGCKAFLDSLSLGADTWPERIAHIAIGMDTISTASIQTCRQARLTVYWYQILGMDSAGPWLEADSNGVEAVSELLAADPDTWEYSIVQKVHEEIITVNDSRCLLLHSRYREVR